MIAVLASGTGSNFEALAKQFANKICALVCNIEGAPVLNLAQKYKVPSFLIPHKIYANREEHEKKIGETLSQLKELKLIVLAGYMRILTPYFFSQKELQGIKIINLHPAHLEEYKGAHAFEYAVERLYPRWGLSIHHVTPELDSGDLINSLEFKIYPYESVEDVQNKVKTLEHSFLVSTVSCLINKEENHGQ